MKISKSDIDEAICNFNIYPLCSVCSIGRINFNLRDNCNCRDLYNSMGQNDKIDIKELLKISKDPEKVEMAILEYKLKNK